MLPLLIIGLGLLFTSTTQAQAQAPTQARRRMVQFTGLVVSGDSLTGVPGALVYVPRSNRRTSTNAQGYFSLVVLAGDSVVIKSAAYTKRDSIPVNYQSQTYSAIIQLNQTTAGALGMNTPLGSFKRDFLNLKLPGQPNVGVEDESNKTYMRKALKRMTYEREAEEKRNSAIKTGRTY